LVSEGSHPFQVGRHHAASGQIFLPVHLLWGLFQVKAGSGLPLVHYRPKTLPETLIDRLLTMLRE
jgi:hypothetical protein